MIAFIASHHERANSVSAKQIVGNFSIKKYEGAQPSWDIHKKAYEVLLASDDDSLLFTSREGFFDIQKLILLQEKVNFPFDIFQIGFSGRPFFGELGHSLVLLQVKSVVVHGLALMPKSVRIFSRMQKVGFSKAHILRLRDAIERQRTILRIASDWSGSTPLIPHLLEPSADCYIISRKAAYVALKFNSEGLLTPERVIFALARSGNFKCVRTLSRRANSFRE
jgi:hypothetical protein